MFFKSRLAVAAVLMTVLFGVLLWRVFYLQIVKGEKYQDNYTLKIVKERTLNSTRGNIYDRNGELLVRSIASYDLMAIPRDGLFDHHRGQRQLQQHR